MSNRVVLDGTNGLKVSRPGFNVLSPNLNSHQISFDSSWTNSIRVVTSGNSVSVSGTNTVNYGTTLPSIPFVFANILSGSEWFTRGGPFPFVPLEVFQVTTTAAGAVLIGGAGPVNDWINPSNHLSGDLRIFTNRFEYNTTTSGVNVSYLVLTDG